MIYILYRSLPNKNEHILVNEYVPRVNIKERFYSVIVIHGQKYIILPNTWKSLMTFTSILLYSPHNKVVAGYIGFTQSVRLSVRPSTCPSQIPRPLCNDYTVLVGSISYLYILSSKFRRCVRCKITCKVLKFEFLAIFKICNFDCVLFWLSIWYVFLVGVIMGRRGVSQNACDYHHLHFTAAPSVIT